MNFRGILILKITNTPYKKLRAAKIHEPFISYYEHAKQEAGDLTERYYLSVFW